MIPEPAPEGGATIGAGRPQPKGRPTEEHEIICDRCSLRPCRCDDEFHAAMASLLYTMTVANGIPLPLRSCFRHIDTMIQAGWLRPLVTPQGIIESLYEGSDVGDFIEARQGHTVIDGYFDLEKAAEHLNHITKGEANA